MSIQYFIKGIGVAFFMLLALVGMGQPEIVWERNYGGSGSDIPHAIIEASDENFVIAGTSTSSDIDVTQNYGQEDFWVIKIDPVGNLIWEKTFGGSSKDEANDIIETSNGDYIIVGTTQSNNGDIGNPLGNNDFWVIKINNQGSLLWEKTFGGTNGEIATKITNNTDGSYIVSGYSASSNGDINNNNGGLDYWVIKINEEGQLIWETNLGSSEDDYAYAATSFNNGNIAIVGYTYTDDQDVSNNYGEADFWLSVIDTGGSLIWEKNYGGSDLDLPYDITIDNEGNIVVVGLSESEDFDVDNVPQGRDCLVLKLDANGNKIWSQIIGSVHADWGNSVRIDANNNILIAGVFNSHGGGFSHISQYGIAKVMSTNVISWEKTIGGGELDGANDMVILQDGSMIVAGFSESDDFDVSNNYGNKDFWIVKLSETPPNAPTALSATDITENSFTANWQSFPNAENYYLDVATDDNFSNFVTDYENWQISNANGQVTSFEVDDLEAGATYYYRLRAETEEGLTENSNVVVVQTNLVDCEQTINFNQHFIFQSQSFDFIFSPNGNLGFFPDKSGNNIHIVERHQVTGELNHISSQDCDSPNKVAISPDGNFLFLITNNLSSPNLLKSYSVNYNTKSISLNDELEVSDSPTSIICDENNHIILGNTTSSQFGILLRTIKYDDNTGNLTIVDEINNDLGQWSTSNLNLSFDKNYIFISNDLSSDLAVFNLSSDGTLDFQNSYEISTREEVHQKSNGEFTYISTSQGLKVYSGLPNALSLIQEIPLQEAYWSQSILSQDGNFFMNVSSLGIYIYSINETTGILTIVEELLAQDIGGSTCGINEFCSIELQQVSGKNFYLLGNGSGSVRIFNYSCEESLLLAPPILTTPENNATNQPLAPTFSWTNPNDPSIPVNYQLSIENATTLDIATNNSAIFNTTYTLPNLQALDYNTTYRWRVKARTLDAQTESDWSDYFYFTTESQNQVDIDVDFSYLGDCPNTPIEFTDLSSANETITAWLWDFGDGQTATGQFPTHTYAAAGDYTVRLTVTAGGVQNTYETQVQILPELQVAIQRIEGYDYITTYEVMQGATVHHYFLVTDANGNPLPELVLGYRLEHNGNQRIEHVISDDNGIIDLNIQLSGEDPSTLDDDWVQQGTTEVFFEEIVTAFLDDYCLDSWSQLQNDFVPITINVSDFQQLRDDFGIYARGGVEACTDCNGLTYLGISGLDINVGAGLGLYYIVNSDYDSGGNLLGYSLTLKGRLDVGGELELLRLDVNFPLEIGESSQALVEIGGELAGHIYGELYFHTDSNEELLYGLLYTISAALDQNILVQSKLHWIKTGVQELLRRLNPLIPVFKGGYGAELSLKANTNLELSFNAFGNRDLKVNLVNLGGENKYEIGVQYDDFENIPSKITYFREYADFELNLLNAELGTGKLSDALGGNILTAGLLYPNMYKGLSYKTFRNKNTDEVLQSQIIFNRSTKVSNNIGTGSIDFSKDYDVALNIKADLFNNLVENTQDINSGLLNFLQGYALGSSSGLQTLNNLALEDINDLQQYMGANYQPSWPARQLTVSSSRTYNRNFEASLSLPSNIPFLNYEATIGVFSNLEYPLFEKQYVHSLNDYLTDVEYIDDESFIPVPENVFVEFWSNLKDAFIAYLDDIKNIVEDWFTEGVKQIEDGIVKISNEERNYLGNILEGLITNTVDERDGFEDFSVLTFTYPHDNSTFEDGTDVFLKYYYPQAEIKGMTNTQDTFLVVSDIFYFFAINGNDTLSTAQNGDFVIETYLGEEDLEYIGLSEEVIVELFYQPFDENTWTSLGMAGNNINSNKIGVYALGVRLVTDNNPPEVNISFPTAVDTARIFNVYIADGETGIDWRTVQALFGNHLLKFKRNGFGNTIEVILPHEISDDLDGTFYLSVQAADNAGNRGLDVTGLTLTTSVENIEIHPNLFKVYPNPSNDYLNVVFELPNSGNISFELVDVVGKTIQTIKEYSVKSGILVKQLQLETLSSGIYFLNLRLDGQLLDNRKIIIQ